METKYIELKENQKVEFKLNFDEKTKNSIQATIKAFLNSYGGTIYIGIADNSEIIGFDSTKHDEVSLWLASKFSKFDSKISLSWEKKFEKNILLIVVSSVDSENDLVFENDGKIFIRVQSSSKKIYGQDLLNFLKNRFVNLNECIKKYLEKNFYINNNIIDLIYSDISNCELKYKKFLKFTDMISNFKTGKLTIESFINNGFYFNLRRELTINKFKKFEFRFDVMCDFSISNIYLNLNMPINAKNIQLDTLYFDSFIVEMDKFFDIQNIKSMFFLLEYKKHYFNIEEKLKEIEEKLKELFGIKNSSALLEELKKQYDSINKKIIMDQLKSFF